MATAKKKSTTRKKAATKKAPAKVTKATGSAVTFTDDIPKVTREFNGSRRSKYDDLLDKLIERNEAGKSSTARMVFETVGQSTSRYQSIKAAIDRREDDAHLFEVAQRTEGESKVVYVKFDPDAEEPEDEEPEDTEPEEEDEDEDEFLSDDEDDDLDF